MAGKEVGPQAVLRAVGQEAEGDAANAGIHNLNEITRHCHGAEGKAAGERGT